MHRLPRLTDVGSAAGTSQTDAGGNRNERRGLYHRSSHHCPV